MKKKILVIDDDLDMSLLLSRYLTRNGYETEEANSGKAGVEKFRHAKFDMVICDYRLGDMEGKEVLEKIKKIDPDAIVIIITGYSDIKTAVDVIRSGAIDYITKPLVPDELLNVLNNISKELAAGKNNVAAPTSSAGQFAADQFLKGQSAAAVKLHHQVEMIANTDYSVILYGQSGTGKEVIAKSIHALSNRKHMPFIAIDCGTLSRELAGSELFGHVKGSFTGAVSDKAGHFEMANGGTLFLDEVANLSYNIQASLLRVIQERRFKRVGDNKEMVLDIRIIVASNENLQEAYKNGKFREDLYYRFNEFAITIPALSSRKEDIPLFAEFFLQKTKTELNKPITGFDNKVMELFTAYAWPGNLREMRNVIRRAVLLTGKGTVGIKELPFEITGLMDNTLYDADDDRLKIIENENPAVTIKETRLRHITAKAEYDAILAVLETVNFNKSKAAELLHIDRKTLFNKIRAYWNNSSINTLS
ncbi:sigma-54-dependent transcriptional regulator [Ferruginibacter profundus]